jgi:hypothetical protein
VTTTTATLASKHIRKNSKVRKRLGISTDLPGLVLDELSLGGDRLSGLELGAEPVEKGLWATMAAAMELAISNSLSGGEDEAEADRPNPCRKFMR